MSLEQFIDTLCYAFEKEVRNRLLT